jgi:hypothetical protein
MYRRSLACVGRDTAVLVGNLAGARPSTLTVRRARV